ncbi:hypothetical protein [Candidatus Frackibacter sp. WG13]|uniref:hypothetical protein n=1 Tax=Candidatus Frackibacter sp. WG13 TaxID=2017978 RepID=UPI0008DF4244|nr:hypothetical protein [Candidatus Frackibacter sp. WG13]SFL34307.1 hypothetical protein SAMN04488699_101108 [Candidatus Frackibacter sp. WG13]
MIKINKKRIDLKGKELDEIKETIDRELSIIYENYKLETIDLGGIDWLPKIISFSLGAVTSGILKEIGKEVWYKIKGLLIESKKKSHAPKFEFEFEYQGIEIIAIVESDDPKELKQAFNNLGDMWDKIVALTESEDTDRDRDKIRLMLDLEEGGWKNKNL